MPYLQPATDTPFGAIPHGPVLSVGKYRKDASAARIYPGDFVMMENDGNVAPATAGSTEIVGVAAEGSAGSTADTEVLVYDHPDQLFVCQDDNDTTHIAETNIGNNCDLIAGAGNTLTNRSAHEIDSNTATDAAANLRIVALHPMELDGGRTGFVSAAAAGNQRKWIIRIAEHHNSKAAGV